MDRYKKLASNTIVLALGQFGSKLLVILLMRFYTGQLGKEGYGVVNTIVDTSTLLMAVATLSIGESLIRFGLDRSYEKGQVFSVGIIVTSIGMAFMTLLFPFTNLLHGVFPDNDLTAIWSDYAWMIYIYVFTGSFKSCCGLFARSIGYVRLYAIDGIFTTIMNILFNLLFLLVFNLGVLGYVLSVILADICSILFLSYIAKLYRYFQLFGIDRDVRNSMLRFSIPMIPTTVMWWITNASDGYFITAMYGTETQALYAAAYKLPNIIALMSGIFSQAWNMSAITESNSRTIAKFYSNVFNMFQSFVYFIAAGLLLVIRPALDIITAEEFHSSYIYTPFLVMSVVFTCFSTFLGSVYVASKKSVRSMATAAAGAVLNIIMNFILIPPFGIQGAAIATFFSYLVIFIARAVDSRKIVYMDLQPLKLAVNCSLLILMGIIIIFVDNIYLYYIGLSLLFLAVTVLNFRVGIQALNTFIKKKTAK